ncbi:MAG: 4Fe-4S dicluster domain-containing protein, partial [Planctomycetota bacterium]|nr:4Fe-4S dicluster domain-containing protein [Planctomycetota bacterium]
MHAAEHAGHATLIDEIRRLSNVDVRKCYQCGRCTAGCPMAGFMDITPTQIMRSVQRAETPEDRDALLRCNAIWDCASCITCSTRCPKEVDVARVIDALRETAKKEDKVSEEQKNILAFHKAFLASIKSTGRIPEFMLIMRYKMSTLSLFQDALLAPKM